jgi:hypothetical protein
MKIVSYKNNLSKSILIILMAVFLYITVGFSIVLGIKIQSRLISYDDLDSETIIIKEITNDSIVSDDDIYSYYTSNLDKKLPLGAVINVKYNINNYVYEVVYQNVTYLSYQETMNYYKDDIVLCSVILGISILLLAVTSYVFYKLSKYNHRYSNEYIKFYLENSDDYYVNLINNTKENNLLLYINYKSRYKLNFHPIYGYLIYRDLDNNLLIKEVDIIDKNVYINKTGIAYANGKQLDNDDLMVLENKIKFFNDTSIIKINVLNNLVIKK